MTTSSFAKKPDRGEDRPAPDFVWTDHGSLVLLRPLTKAGWDWVSENVDPDEPRWMGQIPVSASRVCQVLDAINAAGLLYTN
jgi:hypothetical protein